MPQLIAPQRGRSRTEGKDPMTLGQGKGGSNGARTVVGRRTVLEWIGSAAVVSLASPWLATACGASRGSQPGDATFPEDGGSEGGRDGADGTLSDQSVRQESQSIRCEAGTAFEPGVISDERLQSWGERTVDQQNLASILASWRLRVDGLVDRPMTFDFCALNAMAASEQTTDFHCVEGWSILDVPWNGIVLGVLLDMVVPQAGAKFLRIECVGGTYTETLPIEVAREPRTLLGLGIGGNTLPLSHGFPCRIVVPRLLGYKNPKYVDRIELVDYEKAGFWSERGYPIDGQVPASRLRPGKY